MTGSDYSPVTHPSLPNYLALTSGSTDAISDDCTDCRTRARSIFAQLGSGWRSYEESMPSVGYAGAGFGEYAKRHNPAAYYSAIAGAYRQQDVPLGSPTAGALALDLRRNRLPRYSFITPNLCHDEHDCPLAAGDAWLAQWIPRIITSPAYRVGKTALFITYDEGSGDNRVYTVVVSPSTRPGTIATTRFTHYSLLKTEESMLGLPCLAHACDATTASMRSRFRL